MAPNYKGRRLVDNDGNIYVFECALDVNSDMVEDILLSTEQGITKLVGYRLVIDGVYRDMADQAVAPQSKYNFYKKIEVFSEAQNVSLEDFSTTMKDLIEKARVSRIGRPRITSWKGEPVYEDPRGYYIKRSITCSAEGCESIIEGTMRLSTDTEGDITRGQNFIPNSKEVQRARPGSKLWMCPACSAKSIPVPATAVLSPIEPVAEPVVPDQPEAKKKKVVITDKKSRLLSRLAELSDVHCEVSSDYLKGFLSASMEILMGD